MSEDTLASDVLRGAEAIAEDIWGDKRKARSVYNLVRRKALPVFWIGNVIHARRSTLRRYIEDQEGASSREVAR